MLGQSDARCNIRYVTDMQNDYKEIML